MQFVRNLSIIMLMMFTGTVFAAKSGVYVGLGLGASHMDTPDDYLIGSEFSDIYGLLKQTKPSALSFPAGKAFIGYNFNEYFGLEANYMHFAQAKYTSTFGTTANAEYTYDLNSFNLVGKGYLPISDTGINLYGLAGAGYVISKQAAEGRAPNYTVSGSNTEGQIRPLAGAGISYDFGDSGVSSSLEYNHMFGQGDVKSDASAIPSADMVSFNLAYNFG